ncbi:Hypothetical protein, putative [Bodo saltans]|uniref:Uncharacterized protein n=1 Tax=Bodo saltans TaxID=75058 RepID=A0A0S4IN24_BODSA|nr:Hypothetical protein, putative [Bodo saltans]|eukprot:CUE73795.1 Hypothetical protein, putative [Bodo saltans]
MSDSFEETPQKQHAEADEETPMSPPEPVEDAVEDTQDAPEEEEAPPAPAPAAAPVAADPEPEEPRAPGPAAAAAPAPSTTVAAPHHNTTISDDETSPTRNHYDSGYSETDPSSPERGAAAAPVSNHRPPVGSAANVARSSNATPTYKSGGNNDPHSSRGGGGYSPMRSQAGSRAGGDPSSQRNRPPLVASISYPARQEGLTVADFLDPSKPLVKSTLPLTKPRGPSFAEESSSDARKQVHSEKRMQTAIMSSQILAQRNNERKYLKAQYEFEREKKIAERAIYHKERCMQWTQRLTANPLGVDLVADNERIEEEAYIREKEEKHRKSVAEKRKQRIKRAIIVKALAEVPLLEKARKEKRDLVEGEKREKALRDVQRVEAIQQRKLLDQELMARERQAKLDQRMMSSAASNAAQQQPQRTSSVSR